MTGVMGIHAGGWEPETPPRRLAVLSMHTSPLAQPGTGDGGGMNVYVRELATALARSGVECEVFTRSGDPARADEVRVEPGFTVHHIPAGPKRPIAKEALPILVDEWTARVAKKLIEFEERGTPVAAIHANYWLSGLAGHTLKHQLNIPLIVTFHTLDRVKADASPEELSAAEPARRSEAEARIVGCAESVLASCDVEARQLVELYDADPGRIDLVAPAVEHAFFAPGDTDQARRAVGLPLGDPVILFVGRIQPLKGPTVAVEALAELKRRGGRPGSSTLVVVGGPSGPQGRSEMDAMRRTVERNGLEMQVRFLPPQRHAMLSTYFRAADVCVVPSHSESFGLVALEASACGIPVVASAVGGLTTLVEHGRTGYLVEGRRPADYAEPLARILSEPGLAADLGRRAAERARGYTWRAAAEALWSRVEDLTNSALVPCG